MLGYQLAAPWSYSVGNVGAGTGRWGEAPPRPSDEGQVAMVASLIRQLTDHLPAQSRRCMKRTIPSRRIFLNRATNSLGTLGMGE